jgi:hypothetical protein
MIVDYDVVSENELDVLKARVKDFLANGWQPYGDLQVSTTVLDNGVAPLYIQALVKAHH